MTVLPICLPNIPVVPPVVAVTLLLAEISFNPVPIPADLPDSWPLTARATKVTVVLGQVLENDHSRSHGGIND